MTFIRRAPLFYAALFLSLGIFLYYHFVPDHSARDDIAYHAQTGSSFILGGTIASEVVEMETRFHEKRIAFILKPRKLWKGDAREILVRGRTKVYLKNLSVSLKEGDIVILKGELVPTRPARNPGGFDERAYYRRQDIRALFYGQRGFEPKILGHARRLFWSGWTARAKKSLSRLLEETLPERDAAFLSALFFGERKGLDEDFKQLFLRTGVFHILSVSGFNVGFLAVALFFLLKPFKFPRHPVLVVVCALVWFYCFFVGWQAPVVRASLMMTVFILAQILGRRPNTLNFIGFAALVILLVSPRQLFDIGFQLSFTAVFAITQFTPLFVSKPALLPNERMTIAEKAHFYIQELLAVSFVTLIFSLPITVQHFYIVTPASLLANLIVVPATFLLFYLGILFFLTFWMAKAFFIIPFLIKLLMQSLVACLFVIESIPGAYVTVGKLNSFLWVVMTFGIFYFFYTKQIQRSWVRAGGMIVFLLGIFLAQEGARYFRPFSMTAIDVGQGDAIYFEFPKGKTILMDSGRGGEGDQGRLAVTPFLRSRGVRTLDAIFFSHPQEDHIGGMSAVLDQFKIGKVYEACVDYDSQVYQSLKDKIALKNIPHACVAAGDRIENFPDVTIDVLHPDRNKIHQDINDDSLVLKVSHRETDFLLAGDIEKEAMAEILGRGAAIESTVLKVPHHGARVGSEGRAFFEKVSPRFSVISVGQRNLFGHPTQETLAALGTIPGNQVLRTDKEGAIRLVSDGGKVALDGSF